MESFSTVILLVLGASILLALATGGWTGNGGVTTWLKAKFLGQVSS